MSKFKVDTLILSKQSVTAVGNSILVNGVPIGGSSATNFTSQTIDFGTFNTTAQLVVTGIPWVSVNSVIVATLSGTTTDHPDPIESVIEGITVSISNLVAGVGFTINAYAPFGTTGTYKVNCLSLN